MSCSRQLSERVHQEDAEYASAYRNDMIMLDAVYEHPFRSVMRRLEISSDYDDLMDAGIWALIKDFDGLVADDMCVRFEEVRRHYIRAVFRDGYLKTYLDNLKWRIAMIDKDLLHLFSNFKNDVIQQLEEMERKCPGLDGFYGRGIEIYDSFEVSHGIRSPLSSLENKLSEVFEPDIEFSYTEQCIQ